MTKYVMVLGIALLLCSSCAINSRKSSMLGYTWTFRDSTLAEAIEDIRDHGDWGAYWSFKVRNDRVFDRLVFENVFNREDLLREIKSEIDCEIIEAGRSALIVLPKLE